MTVFLAEPVWPFAGECSAGAVGASSGVVGAEDLVVSPAGGLGASVFAVVARAAAAVSDAGLELFEIVAIPVDQLVWVWPAVADGDAGDSDADCLGSAL
jgi:hypothetical protein